MRKRWIPAVMMAVLVWAMAAGAGAEAKKPFALTFGEPVGSPERTDIRNARCLTLIGSHLGENMHNTQAQEFAEAVGSGASVIVVDPRLSVAASKAKHYLAEPLQCEGV